MCRLPLPYNNMEALSAIKKSILRDIPLTTVLHTRKKKNAQIYTDLLLR